MSKTMTATTLANPLCKPVIHGLYAITPSEGDSGRLRDMVEASIVGGASVIQYRNKRANSKLRHEQSRLLLELCRRHQVPLIINDDINLCLEIDADGVHIGATDGDLKEVRTQLGQGRILGASCYNSLMLATKAQDEGADYIAFGACFPSTTKPDALRADLSLFSRGREVLHIPKVAIGGITLDNARLAINAGAEALAVIGALFESGDVEHTAREFSRLYQTAN
jgi:thiamine-phosphate pyrophosphorylase